MRVFPILIAALVAVSLYFLVLDRDRLMAFAGRDDPAARPASETSAAPQPAVAEPAPRRVVVTESRAQPIETAVVLRGRTEAERQVTVATEIQGRVIEPPLRKGARVAAGDRLCKLDPGTRESQLTEAQARLTEAEARVPEAQAALSEAQATFRARDIDVTAARQLSEGGFASETRLATAEAAQESALAGIERARSALSSAEAGIEAARASVEARTREIAQLTIAAPFAGLLETDTAELGTLLQPGQPCATVVQLDPLKLVGFVPELDVARLEPGAPAQARLATGEEVTGQVSFVARAADPATRTFRVEVTVPNPDLTLRDGQTAEIVIAADGLSAHLVPQSALTLDNEGTLGVRTVEDGITRFLPARVVRDTPEGMFIAGLPDMAQIITLGQDFVVDGVPVTPVRESDLP